MGRVKGYYFYSPQSSSVIKSKISPGHPKYAYTAGKVRLGVNRA